METIFVQVENKKDADLIRKFLSKMQSVINIGTSTNKKLNKMIEELEMEEDIHDAKKLLSSKEKPIAFDDVVKKWKQEGKL
jgi:hypothetical protein